ncbi:MAG: hypothetical protein CMC04_09700 [Flavobacteriaceae bacterium]|nr:hypothetical protein [Flavobacteriaceae bacterium]|tara:strand:- start:2582 stop:3748 length:1167 start_codon:yes stop_codon:yes gene_type:complete
MRISFSKNNRNIFLPAFIVLVTLQPFLIWQATQLTNYICGILMLFIAYNHAEFTKENIRMSFFFVICNLFYFLAGTTYKTFSPVFFLPLVFLILPKIYQKDIFEKFLSIISVIFALGFITYFLRFFVDLPSFSLSPLNDLKKDFYDVYLFDVTLPQDKSLLPKFFSLFDENGVVGTLCALLISYKKLSISSFTDKVILLAGIISFSLTFYIVLIINLVYNFNKRYVLIFPLLFFIYSIIPNTNTLNIYILDRLKITEKGISGDNRTSKYFDENFDYFISKGGNDILFGRGLFAEVKDDKYNIGLSSYKVLVYRHGILGCLLFLSFFTFLTWKLAPTSRGFFFLLIFILLLYQRINLFLYYNIVTFVGGLLMINYNQLVQDKLKKSALK